MGDIDKEDDSLAIELSKNTMTGQWKKVVEMYEKHKIKAFSAKINTSGDTALHVAVSIASDKDAQQLVRVIKDWYDTEVKKAEKEITDILESAVWIKNNEGNTPLHVAASAQRISICFLLIRSFNSIQPLGMQNNRGESPLFLAAFHGHKNIFLCLHVFFLLGNSNTDSKSIDPAYLRCFDGETILHCAIRWEYFDMAFEILNVEPGLACSVSGQGITPLHLLASKPAVFKIGFRPGWWKKIIYHCIYVEELKSQTTLPKLIDSFTKEENNQNFRKSYQACICFYRKLKAKAQVVIRTIKEHRKGRNEDVENPSKSNITGQSEKKGQNADEENTGEFNVTGQLEIEGQNADEENTREFNVIGQSEIEGSQDWSKAQQLQFFIRRYAINIFYLFYKILSWVILRLGYEDLKKIKEKHVHSVQIMKLLVKHANDAKFDFSSWVGPKQITETPVLLAAGNGITKMVEQILEAFPVAINDRSEGKNIVHWAVKNRQPRVLQLLLKRDFVKRKLIHEVDTDENNALHLAAKIGKKKPWLIPGAALQMQWEFKWYEFVKDNMPQHFCYQLNGEGKTPEEIFNETHEELVKQGGAWLNKTSKSYSVVAALIATVAFAASTTIPGNINEKSGKPNLENQSELTVFAISSPVALCFSITALFSFLSILTSRYEHKDFRRDLLEKLLLGLTSLFVSITSMLVSFCAGHFFMLKNKLKDKAFPVYAATCLPIVLFAIQQLPLYLDIAWAIFKKVP
ncbi:hypothetical protein ACJW31_10G173900 [Castanea mollissima]